VFFPLGAFILRLILFFMVALPKNSNRRCPPRYPVSGYTLGSLVFLALKTQGGHSRNWFYCSLGCGIIFAARQIGNLSERDGMALSKTIRLGVIALSVVSLGQLLLSWFGVYTPTWLKYHLRSRGVSALALGRFLHPAPCTVMTSICQLLCRCT